MLMIWHTCSSDDNMYGSDVVITVVHPDAISLQNPYEDLDYSNLPDIP